MNKPRVTSIARALRHEETEAEKIIWSWLRRKQLSGAKFRRQQPIGNYVVDFVNFDKKLIIEIDGGQHTAVGNRENDNIRTGWLESQGFRVMRFWNNDIFSNLEGVLKRIGESLDTPSSCTSTIKREGTNRV